MTVNELDSRIAERGDSILYKFLLLGSFASEAARQLTSFSG